MCAGAPQRRENLAPVIRRKRDNRGEDRERPAPVQEYAGPSDGDALAVQVRERIGK